MRHVPSPPDWLAAQSAANPSNPFLHLEHEQLTFGDVEAMVGHVCLFLQAAVPTMKGHNAAIWNTDSKLTVILLFACARLGWPVTVLAPALPSAVLARHLAQVPLTLLLFGAGKGPNEAHSRTFDGAVEQLAVEMPVAGSDSSAPIWRQPNAHTVGNPDLEWIQGWVFTSGTTGTPKAVTVTFGNLLWSTAASSYRLGYQISDCWLHCMPLHHIGGLALLFRSLIFGFSLCMRSRFDQHEVRDFMERGTVTHAALVPTMLARLLDANLDLTAPGQRFRTVLAGGAKVAESLRSECGERGLDVVASYGMTESCSHIAAERPGRTSRSGEGPALRHAGIQIRNVDGERLPAEHQGTIWIKGPQLSSSCELDGQGWFRTGDWGMLDDNGSVHVLDRQDGVFVSGGENVSSRHVAESLMEFPGIEHAWVTGVPDREWGHRVVAVMQPATNRVPDEHALRRRLRTRLAVHEVPRQFVWVASLPRTELGKVDAAAARQLVEELQP
ncbi:MAG: class I adenylate-forming enzyme family protein [Caldilineaceae bacterium]|nr:class I adenylate-forming enzyme family protein [Caldilineaceae bacterium]